jgi:hypothetical protein
VIAPFRFRGEIFAFPFKWLVISLANSFIDALDRNMTKMRLGVKPAAASDGENIHQNKNYMYLIDNFLPGFLICLKKLFRLPHFSLICMRSPMVS